MRDWGLFFGSSTNQIVSDCVAAFPILKDKKEEFKDEFVKLLEKYGVKEK